MPALRAPISRVVVALGALGVAFAAYTQVVAGGLLAPLDLHVARALQAAWMPALQPPAQVVAVAGGIEVTTLLAAGLAVVLWKRRSRVEAAALLALPLGSALEALYKWALEHPPPLAFSHPDGPSLVTMLHGGTLTLSGSYPSGHMMRTVLVYGLGAFVVRRMASPAWARTLAAPAAAIVVGLMALDRVYLGVHWQSDVVGGLLLGGAAMAAAIAWLDRPRAAA